MAELPPSPEALRAQMDEAFASLRPALTPPNPPVARAAMQKIVSIAFSAPDATLKNHASKGLCDIMRTAPDDACGALSLPIVLGALVERGADPEVSIGDIIDRLKTIAKFLLEDNLVQTMRKRAGEEITPNPAAIIGRQLIPELDKSAVSHLAASRAALERYRADAELDSILCELRRIGGSLFILMLLEARDGEMTVIHAEEKKGFIVKYTNLADNVQMHVLLAGALIGDEKEGKLSGTQPSPEAIAAASTGFGKDPGFEGVWNMYTWQGVTTDASGGPAPPDAADTRFWVWNEGTPTREIPPRPDGSLVLLLGPASVKRGMQAGRTLLSVPTTLELVRVLTPEEVHTVLYTCLAEKAMTDLPPDPVAELREAVASL
jgi:hypothetical protein